MPARRRALPALLLAVLATAAAGCARVSAAQLGGGGLRVVAAENFWGSIARQLGGSHATVLSIIVNPAQDPHSYEPTAQDARTMAVAQLAIVNGIGYDPWASRLLAADPVDGRIALSVGRLLGLHEGANPHRWYDPGDVARVAGAVAADLERLDPRHRAYYARRLAWFDGLALAGYHALMGRIRSRYAGVTVGASESIFAPLALRLGLRLLTPPSFMRAISEGTELTAQDISAAERQLDQRRIAVWIYNAQNVTPEIQRLNGLARSHRIPIVSVTETVAPAGASFENWQVTQLRRLEAALREATGR